MTPMKSILDASFRYVPSNATDVRKTFARIRREREMAERAPESTVVQISAKKTIDHCQ
jgi:hypothetical protein